MSMIPWQDIRGESIIVDPATGLVKVDGVTVFKVRVVSNILHVQFKDNDKQRCYKRGSDLIEVSLPCLIQKISEGCT